MNDILTNAEKVRSTLKINYDNEGIEHINHFIDHNRFKFTGDKKIGLINSCAAFVGQCIVNTYGGNWVPDNTDYYCIQLECGTLIYPFTAVRQHFEYGKSHSVCQFFFEISENHKKDIKQKWWTFWKSKK